MLNLNHEIEKAQSIAIAGHIRPDGDCVGSCLGLKQYIKDNYPDKNVKVYLEPVAECFHYLPGFSNILHEVKSQEYDLFFCLDCGDASRLGFSQELSNHSGKTIVVDHHISNAGFGDVNVIEPQSSSTCEVLCGYMNMDQITTECATALYTGIIHDTGVFKHSNTSRRTMEYAGKLIEKEISFSQIIDESFYQKTYIQNQILGRCLLESVSIMNGTCIFAVATKKMLDFYGASSADLDGIIDQLRITKGVEVAIFLYETGIHEYKVSMRSNTCINVSKIAVAFGGGGHVKAAGCSMKSASYHDIINNITEQISLQMNEH